MGALGGGVEIRDWQSGGDGRYGNIGVLSFAVGSDAGTVRMLKQIYRNRVSCIIIAHLEVQSYTKKTKLSRTALPWLSSRDTPPSSYLL